MMTSEFTKCEHSRLRLPADRDYGPIAARFVADVARKIGFAQTACVQIQTAVSNAFTAVVKFSFPERPTESIDLTCERTPVGIQVSLVDQGIPFDYASHVATLKESDPQQGEGLLQLEPLMDEVQFNNLGAAGKAIVLIKHLKGKNITEYDPACRFEPADPTGPDLFQAEADITCTAGPLELADAIEVSKSVFQTYGYAYRHEFVYYPELLAEMNRRGQLHSAVAYAVGTDPVGKKAVAGHCALMYSDESDEQTTEPTLKTAELAIGMVKPAYRSLGCFEKMTAYLIDKARADGIGGIHTQAVASHPWSQKTGHRFRLKDCAIRLGGIPAGIRISGISPRAEERISMVLQFRYLQSPAPATIYPPRHHLEMILRIYDCFDQSVTIKKGVKDGTSVDHQAAIINTQINLKRSTASIEIQRSGADAVAQVKAQLRALCLKKIDVIDLRADLSDPQTALTTAAFEKLGFVWTGIMPWATPRGDAVVMQYLNNVRVTYDKIHLASPLARELLAYIRLNQPTYFD